jgi:hypothetical protein
MACTSAIVRNYPSDRRRGLAILNSSFWIAPTAGRYAEFCLRSAAARLPAWRLIANPRPTGACSNSMAGRLLAQMVAVNSTDPADRGVLDHRTMKKSYVVNPYTCKPPTGSVCDSCQEGVSSSHADGGSWVLAPRRYDLILSPPEVQSGQGVKAEPPPSVSAYPPSRHKARSGGRHELH